MNEIVLRMNLEDDAFRESFTMNEKDKQSAAAE